MDRATRIAILSAGLAGLTTAGLLQRAGFFVAVYEQSPSFSRIGAAIILGANVAKVLRRLDLERRLTATGIRPDTFLSRAWDTGETTYQLVFDAACEARFDGMYGDLQGIAGSAIPEIAILDVPQLDVYPRRRQRPSVRSQENIRQSTKRAMASVAKYDRKSFDLLPEALVGTA